MPHRKRIRCPKYDYSLPGNYFITICTKNRHPWFGKIVDGEVVLSEVGERVHKCWYEIVNHFSDVYLDQFVIMPDHIHGIVCINDPVGADHHRPIKKQLGNGRPMGGKCSAPTDLSSVVRGFKIGVTKWCHQNHHPNFAWQRSFHDRIIRNDSELQRIRHYIFHNPNQ